MTKYDFYKVNLIKASDAYGNVLLTYQMSVPRMILAEMEKHRNLSMSVESSRAVSLDKTTSGSTLTYVPLWTLNQKGMRGKRITDSDKIYELDNDWENVKNIVLEKAIALADKGIHKQNVNRLLEPFMFVDMVVTLELSALEAMMVLRHPASTTYEEVKPDEWDDQFPAQPEFQVVAIKMWEAYKNCKLDYVLCDEWHVPYINVDVPSQEQLFYSVGRCANISYGVNEYSFEKFVEIGEKMMRLKHPTPTEHQCKFPNDNEVEFMEKRYDREYRTFELGKYYSNFQNWIQFRKILENG